MLEIDNRTFFYKNIKYINTLKKPIKAKSVATYGRMNS